MMLYITQALFGEDFYGGWPINYFYGDSIEIAQQSRNEIYDFLLLDVIILN